MCKLYIHTHIPALHTDDTHAHDTMSNNQTSPLPQSNKLLPSRLT